MKQMDKAYEDFLVIKRYIQSCKTEPHLKPALIMVNGYAKYYQDVSLHFCTVLEDLYSKVRNDFMQDEVPVVFEPRLYRYFNA